LRGWAISDDKGKYGIDTIRPAGYTITDLPAHIQMHIVEVSRCTYYIDDIMFEDESRLTQQQRHKLALGRGGTAIVAPTRDASGIWAVTRDIVLG
jgi:protocatechuate 3,4-dioxygenase, beta subunit